VLVMHSVISSPMVDAALVGHGVHQHQCQSKGPCAKIQYKSRRR
jgi:hypothetical protein